MGVHLNPNLYPNPKEWNPHHFDEDKVAKRHPGAYVPFSLGPRMCIGKDGRIKVPELMGVLIIPKAGLKNGNFEKKNRKILKKLKKIEGHF